MTDVPEYYQRAVDLLRAECPELEPAWCSLVALMGSDEAFDVGIYNVLGQMVLPSVAYLLQDAKYAALPERDPDFAHLPSPATPEAEGFLTRLYAVLDSWAASPEESLNEAIFIEFAESGYSTLSVSDLVRYAGPRLREMAGGSA